MPRVIYAMDHRPRNRFLMSYASRKVIFPGGLSLFNNALKSLSLHVQIISIILNSDNKCHILLIGSGNASNSFVITNSQSCQGSNNNNQCEVVVLHHISQLIDAKMIGAISTALADFPICFQA